MKKLAFWAVAALLCDQVQAQSVALNVRVHFVPQGVEISGPGMPKKVTCKGDTVNPQFGENPATRLNGRKLELRVLVGTGKVMFSRPVVPPLPLLENELRFSCLNGKIGLSNGPAVEVLTDEED